MANEKEEFRSKMNKIIDEEDDIKGLFSCANIGQNCNALKHCCGTYQCSGLVIVPDLFSFNLLYFKIYLRLCFLILFFTY